MFDMIRQLGLKSLLGVRKKGRKPGTIMTLKVSCRRAARHLNLQMSNFI